MSQMVNNHLSVPFVFDFDLTIFVCTPVSPCPLSLGIDLKMTTPETKPLLVLYPSCNGCPGQEVGRGTFAIGAQNSSTVPLFAIIASKNDIAHYLKQRAAKSGHMTWTILRATVFMNPLILNFEGEMFATIIKTSLRPSRPVVYITRSVIRFFALYGL